MLSGAYIISWISYHISITALCEFDYVRRRIANASKIGASSSCHFPSLANYISNGRTSAKTRFGNFGMLSSARAEKVVTVTTFMNCDIFESLLQIMIFTPEAEQEKCWINQGFEDRNLPRIRNVLILEVRGQARARPPGWMNGALCNCVGAKAQWDQWRRRARAARSQISNRSWMILLFWLAQKKIYLVLVAIIIRICVKRLWP